MKHVFDLSGLNSISFNLLLDRRCCQTEHHWAFLSERILWIELVEEEISHDQIVRMILIGVMALVKHKHVDIIHMHEPMSQEIVEFVGNDD